MNRLSLIMAPTFTYSDLIGPWRVEPTRFHPLLEMFRTPEFTARIASHDPTPTSTTSYRPGTNGKQVAVLGVHGPMLKPATWFGTSTVQLRNDIRLAAMNPDVSAILLDIWSPGGTVAGMDALLADVRDARKRKPVWAQVDDMGASAAYELASQADAIFATGPTTTVGSIGTMMAVYDMSAMAEKDGIKAFMFRTGPLKGAGFPGTPLTEDQQLDFQKWVDQSQLAFDGAVREGRGLSESELAAVRTGGVFLAPEALGLRLIDGIQSLDKTLADISSAA